MKNLEILDATLRDGGFNNEFNFGIENIRKIICGLIDSKIDIIELGFIDETSESNINKTILPKITEFDYKLEGIEKNNTKIYTMIDYGKCKIENIVQKKETLVDGIRVIFTKENIEKALLFCSKLKELGYEVFANPVNITYYNENDFKLLFTKINETNIDGVCIVDTYGIMEPSDVKKIYNLLNNNLNKDLIIGFHAHNNKQFATGNCLAFLEENKDNRKVIVDGTLNGYGKGLGNAHTEIIANLKMCQKKYDISRIITTIEKLPLLFENKNLKKELSQLVSSICMIYYKYTDYYIKKGISFKDIIEIGNLIEYDEKYKYTDELAEKYLKKYQKKYKYDLIIFDLDGTLMETTLGIIKTIDKIIEKNGLEPLTEQEKLKFIGPPIEKALKERYNLPEEKINIISKEFRKIYYDENLFDATIYRGIINVLEKLETEGIKIGLATYKREPAALSILDKFGIIKYFDSKHGTDMEGKKSKSDIITEVIKECGIETKKTLMIGDTKSDLIAAEESKVDFLHAKYGFGNLNTQNKVSEPIEILKKI